MKHFIIFTILASLLMGAFFVCLSQPSLATAPTPEKEPYSPLKQLDVAGKKAKYATGEDQDIRMVAVTIIQNVLLFVGFIFVILMIYGGYLWMTAGGNEEQLTKAKKVIVNSIIAVGVIFLSVSITYTLNRILYDITTQRSIEAGIDTDRGPYLDY